MTFRKVTPATKLVNEKKLSQAQMTPWHVPSSIWVHLGPRGSIFLVKNQFSHIFPASAWSPFLSVILTDKLARLLVHNPPFYNFHSGRPLSVPFLFRASGKGTDTATMLRLEKYGRIDFSLGRWATTDQNAPKSMRAHARESFELATTFFCSLSKSQQPLFQRSSFRLHQNGVKFTSICFGRYSIFLGYSISHISPAPPMHWATLPGSKNMFFGTK